MASVPKPQGSASRYLHFEQQPIAGSWRTGKGKARIAATIPLRRIPPPEDIAGPILFLCSPLARHITGEILNVNGGSVLCG